MSELVQRVPGTVTRFDPKETRAKLAHLDGDITKWRKLGDWPKLVEAVDAKIAEQAAFVANWDKRVRANHRPITSAVARELSSRDAEAAWGVIHQTVSRWRKALADIERYHARIMLGAFRPANLAPAENHRAEGTGENEWFTPAQYIAAARSVMGAIDLDPATHLAAQEVVEAKRFYTRADDGLTKQWRGRVWLNPPYAQPHIAQFVAKLVDEFTAGRVSQAIMLTHNYTDTAWFHLAAASASVFCFTRGRIRFVDIDGDECAPTQGQAFFYYGTRREEFAATFGEFGLVLCRA
jgi:phage N-6-adenine-methyltransferase